MNRIPHHTNGDKSAPVTSASGGARGQPIRHIRKTRLQLLEEQDAEVRRTNESRSSEPRRQKASRVGESRTESMPPLLAVIFHEKA